MLLCIAIIFTLVMTLTMIGFGLLFVKRPPVDINVIFGYRTSMSMKNEDTWRFAHSYAGRLWIWLGTVTLVVSLPLLIIFSGSDFFESLVSAVSIIQTIIVMSVIPPTEIALRKRFDRDGKPRDQKNGG